jgi:hypothetical protein
LKVIVLKKKSMLAKVRDCVLLLWMAAILWADSIPEWDVSWSLLNSFMNLNMHTVCLFFTSVCFSLYHPRYYSYCYCLVIAGLVGHACGRDF